MPTSTIGKSAFAKLQHLPALFDHINSANEDITENSNIGENSRVSENIIEQVNECFNAMASHWQQGNYSNILEQADDLPLYSLCDIRICVYYLYSFWITENKYPTVSIISVLTNILKHDQRPCISTIDRQPLKNLKIFNSSIGLLLRKIFSSLEINSYQQKYSNIELEDILKCLYEFKAALDSVGFEVYEENYGYFIKIEKYFYAIEAEKEIEKSRTETIDLENTLVESELNETLLDCGESLGIMNKNKVNPKRIDIGLIDKSELIDTATFNPSYALRLLLDRMLALQKLIQKQHDFKAAIVLADIQSELDNFNPLIYFPEYFVNFASLRAKNVAKLEPYFAQQKTYQWQVLNEYYHADLHAFVELKQDESEFSASENDSERYSENYSNSYMESEYND